MRLRSCAAIGFLWGFAEGSVFYIVPDVCITCFALFSFRESLKALFASVAGALLAGLLMYGLAYYDPPLARKIVLSVPFVSAAMFDQSAKAYALHAWLAPIYAPLSFTPYKVYAVEAVNHIGVLSFVLASILARFGRIGSAWALASLLRVALNKIATPPAGLLYGVHFLFWVSFYWCYWRHLEF